MEFKNKKIYTDTPGGGREYRQRYVDSLHRYIEKGFAEAEAARDARLSPEKMAADRETFRAEYCQMLGVDYREGMPPPSVTAEYVGQDDFCKIERLSVEVMDDFYFYGILFIPHSAKEKNPLVVCQHGGYGSPETCSSMLGPNNYSSFVQKSLLRGCIVFAPQILVWGYGEVPEGLHDFSVAFDRMRRDADLRQLGRSMTGLEIFCIMRCLDYLLSLPSIDKTKVGMTGVSYGGYFSLYTAAADPRIKAVYSAAAFNGRSRVYFDTDWVYYGGASSFHDAEIAGLCAPRKLFVDVGKGDLIFDYRPSVPEAARAQAFYDAAGASDAFSFDLWEGGHCFDDEGDRFERFLDAVFA